MTTLSPHSNSPHFTPRRIHVLAEFRPRLQSPLALPEGYSIVHSTDEYPTSSLDWADNVIRYDSALDSLRLYFQRTESSAIKSTTAVAEGLDVFAAKDEDNRIRFLEFRQADKTLVPHTFDTMYFFRHQPPLQLHHTYDSISDLFCVYLVSQEHSAKLDIVNVYDPSITIVFDVEQKTKRISGFQIIGASKCVAKDNLSAK